MSNYMKRPDNSKPKMATVQAQRYLDGILSTITVMVRASWIGNALKVCQTCFVKPCVCQVKPAEPAYVPDSHTLKTPDTFSQFNRIYNFVGSNVTANCGRCNLPTEIPLLRRITICVGFRRTEETDTVLDDGKLVEIVTIRSRPSLKATDGCPACYALYATAKAETAEHEAKTGETKAAFLFPLKD